MSHGKELRAPKPPRDSRYYNGVTSRRTICCGLCPRATLGIVVLSAVWMLAQTAVGARQAQSGPTSSPAVPTPSAQEQQPAPSGEQQPGTGTATPAQDPGTPRARRHGSPLLRVVWTNQLPAPPVARPAFDESRTFVPLRDQLVAASLADGKLLWTTRAPPARRPGHGRRAGLSDERRAAVRRSPGRRLTCLEHCARRAPVGATGLGTGLALCRDRERGALRRAGERWRTAVATGTGPRYAHEPCPLPITFTCR